MGLKFCVFTKDDDENSKNSPNIELFWAISKNLIGSRIHSDMEPMEPLHANGNPGLMLYIAQFLMPQHCFEGQCMHAL